MSNNAQTTTQAGNGRILSWVRTVAALPLMVGLVRHAAADEELVPVGLQKQLFVDGGD